MPIPETASVKRCNAIQRQPSTLYEDTWHDEVSDCASLPLSTTPLDSKISTQWTSPIAIEIFSAYASRAGGLQTLENHRAIADTVIGIYDDDVF